MPAPVELASGGEKNVATIQELLAKLGYYDGEVDGLRGPMTNAAIDTYKKSAGLRGIELDDAELTTSMRNHLDVTAGIPAPKPAPVRPDAGQSVAELIAKDTVPLPLPSQIPSAEVVKVQAALKAFGNTDVVVDGIPGAQTEAAIREFQVLFHLPVNGEIDGVLLDKMRTVGLIH
jgi:peptidoglycan hydrolase-like protein with peptidoglycan-binding domain